MGLHTNHHTFRVKKKKKKNGRRSNTDKPLLKWGNSGVAAEQG